MSLLSTIFRNSTYKAFQEDMKELYGWSCPKQSLAMARRIAKEVKEENDFLGIPTTTSVLQGPGDASGIRGGLTKVLVEYTPMKLFSRDGTKKTEYGPDFFNGQTTYSIVSPSNSLYSMTKNFFVEPNHENYDLERHKSFILTSQPRTDIVSIGQVLEKSLGSRYKTVRYRHPGKNKAVDMFYVSEEDLNL